MKRILAVCAAVTILAMGAVLTAPRPVRADASIDTELAASIAKLNEEQKAALLVLVKGIVEAQAVESPVDGAMKTVRAYVEAAEAADIDTVMEQISDDFSHYEVGDKDGYRGFLEQVKAEGMLEGVRGDTEGAKAEVDDDTVTVYPVDLEGIFGTVTLEIELKKDGDSWKIIGLETSGV